MLALIRMDWTLNRRVLLQLMAILGLFWLPLLARGIQGWLAVAFELAALVMCFPLFQNLRNPVDAFTWALPVSRDQVVLARYISALAGMALVLAGFLALACGWRLLPWDWARNLSLADLAAGLACLGLIQAALLFLLQPFLVRFGGELGVGLFMATLLAGALALLFGFGWQGLIERSLELGGRLLDGGPVRAWALVAWLLLGAASVAISLHAGRRRSARVPSPAFLPVLLLAAVWGLFALAGQAVYAETRRQAIQTSLDGLLAPAFRAHRPGSAVLVMADGKVLLRRSYGRAADVAGLFPIASVSKQFTAALVLLLAEDGRLDLERPIRGYLPELPAAWGRVTLEQCLAHTGGIPEFTQAPGFDAALEADRDLDPAGLLALLERDQPLDFEPGSRWQYSNTGYLLLGMALERVSGRGYGQLLRERICQPLGLRNTHYGPVAGMLPGHVEDAPAPRAVPGLLLPYGAGGILSTIDDLGAWALALHGGKLLRPASLARMTRSGRTADGKATGYGFGLLIAEPQGHRVLLHAGRTIGYSSYLAVDPGRRAVVAVLSATATPPVLPLQRLLDTACGRPAPLPVAVRLPAAELEAVVGRYEVQPGLVLRVWRAGAGLRVQATGQPELELLAESRTRFFFKVVEAGLEFEPGPDGRAKGLILSQGGRTTRAKRIDG